MAGAIIPDVLGFPMFREYDRGVIRVFKVEMRVGGRKWELPEKGGQ